MSSFVGAPASISGTYVSIADQIGTRTATASGSPAAGTGTINANNYAKLDATNDKFSFTSLALGSGDWTLFAAVGNPTAGYTNLGAIIGRAGGTTSIRGTSNTNFDFRSDSAGPVSYGTIYGAPPGFQVLRFERTGGNITVYVNGEAMGSPVGRAIAGNFTFDQLGVSSASTAFSAMGLGEILIFTRIFSSTYAAIIEADMQTAWRSGVYISSSGSDSALGWNAETAFQTITATRAFQHRRGSKIFLKRGDTFRRDPLLFNLANTAGIAGDPVVINAYGTASDPRPKFIGSTQVTGAYTNVSGNEYKKTVALTSVQGAWAYDGSSNITRLTLGTSGSLTTGQYAYSAGDFHFNIGGDPTAYTFEVAQSDGSLADTRGLRLANPYFTARSMHLIHWPLNGVEMTGSYTTCIDPLSEWNANDGINGDATNVYVGQGTSRYNGAGISQSGANGDGVSFHGGSTGTIEDMQVLYNDKAGIDHQDGVVMTMRRCLMQGNNQQILVASNALSGTQRWENCIAIRMPGNYQYAVQLLNGAKQECYNLTIVNLDAAVGTGGIYISQTNTTDLRNVITDGFATGLVKNASTGVTNNHNIHHDTAAYSGLSGGVGDLISDPLFTNRAGADFSLQAGSPAKHAGVSVNVTTDYLNALRGSPPSVGAYE